MTNFFIFLAFLTLFLTILKLSSKGKPNLQGHWNTLLDGLNYSSKDFYELLTKELKSHGIDDVKMEEKFLSIGNSLGVKRLYLRVTWKEYTYDCCCSPFGNGTFVSWWLFSELKGAENIISKLPFIGGYIADFFYPPTYYKSDSASMFMTYAQTSVLKVIDDITKAKGIKALSENERKPILKDIFKR